MSSRQPCGAETMAEIAGVVLGGIPIALWAFDRYREPVESYCKYDMTLSTLQDNIFIQQQQLRTTLGLIGLDQPCFHEVQEWIREKYPSRHEEILSIVAQMDRVTKSLLDKLEVDTNGKVGNADPLQFLFAGKWALGTVPPVLIDLPSLLWTDIGDTMQPLWTDEPTNRARWEWRRVKRSFSTKQRKALVDNLQYWNTALKNSFEKPELPAQDENTTVQEVQARFNPKHCDSIREDVGAIHGALKDSWNCGCPCSHYATIHLDWQSTMFSLPSVFDVALSFRDSSSRVATADYRWRKFQIHVEKIPSGNGTPIASSIPSAQSSEVPSPTTTTISKRSKVFRFFSQPQTKKSSLVTFAGTSGTGTLVVVVLIEHGHS